MMLMCSWEPDASRINCPPTASQAASYSNPFSGAMTNTGTLTATHAVNGSGNVDNSGTIHSVNVQLGGGNNRGILAAEQTLTLNGRWDNSGHMSATDIDISGGLGNSGGVEAADTLTINGGTLTNSGNLIGGQTEINVGSAENSGTLVGQSALSIFTTHGLVNSLDERQQCAKNYCDPDHPQPDDFKYYQQSGTIVTSGVLTLGGGDVDNRGTIQAGSLRANLTGAFNNTRSANDLYAVNNYGNAPEDAAPNTGIIHVAGDMSVNATGFANNGGVIQAGGALNAQTGGAFTNVRSGEFAPSIFADSVDVRAARIANEGTLIATNGDAMLRATSGGVTNADNAVIGAGAIIEAGAVIGDKVSIGEDTHIYPNVVVYPRCRIGARTILHSGCVIGADGFGFAFDAGRWIKIPQIGRVVIGDDVEIGANTTIDRGALDDTVIENDVKIDNQVQIGHNCEIGEHAAIVACTGIAGSVRVGRYCRIGGAAMIGGHLTIGEGVVIGAASPVFSSIEKPGVYSGIYPILPHRQWQKNAVQLRQLDALYQRVRALEKKLDENK